jgi:glycosyltransferase involved in cell wall biosynthesis
VVATAVGGIPAVVRKETAILVHPSDPIAISDACIKLAGDLELRLKMGRAGHERVIKEYSIDAMVDRTVSLYMELLKLRGRQDLIPAGVEN